MLTLRPTLGVSDRARSAASQIASGVAYAVLAGLGPQAAADHGAAHGALAMTTPGDASMVDGAEVEAAIEATGASVIR